VAMARTPASLRAPSSRRRGRRSIVDVPCLCRGARSSLCLRQRAHRSCSHVRFFPERRSLLARRPVRRSPGPSPVTSGHLETVCAPPDPDMFI
jgi:hypothetical protein